MRNQNVINTVSSESRSSYLTKDGQSAQIYRLKNSNSSLKTTSVQPQVIAEEMDKSSDDSDDDDVDNKYEMVENVDIPSRNMQLQQSTDFLLKVVQGIVPNDILGSQISQADLDNLQSIIPDL